MPRVVHFEIPAENPERAVKFYSTVFDWKIDRWGGPVDYWLVETGKATEMGINGAIKKQTGGGVVNTIGVSSIDEYFEKIKAAGGKILTEKMTIPGIGYHAYFRDTEGNVSGILQPDMKAR